MNEPVIRAQGVARTFTTGPLPVPVLQGIDLQVLAGQTVSLVGRSGSGKSTLLHVLGGLDRPDAGQVWWGDWAVRHEAVGELGRRRNAHLGFVYQFHHLIAELSAEDNVAMPLWIRRQSRAQARKQALLALDQVGLAERAQHLPSELSGGERQRVAVARALALRPRLLLADEPTGSLDPALSREVMDLLFEQSLRGCTVVVSTHDHALVSRYRARVVEVRGGVVSRDERP